MAIATPAQAHAPYVAKAWGANNHGQLGDGTITGPEKCGSGPLESSCSTVPVAVSKLSGVTAVAGGPATSSQFSLALLEGGRVMAWGSGNQLGDGTGTDSDVPVAVCAVGTESTCPTGPFLKGATGISAGEVHALALLSNGTVMAWGNNPFGQLGTGIEKSSFVPLAVCGVGAKGPCSEESQQLKGVIAIAAGGEHSLALLSDHTVVAWGEGSFGELGNGTTEPSLVPVKVSGLTEVAAIAAGYRHSLALLKDGTVMAWGENFYGTLGNGTTEKSDVAVAVSGLKEVTAISAGMHHSVALLSNGTVKAWGSNETGQLGTGTSAGPEACGTNGACSKTPAAVCAGSPPGPCPTGPLLSGVSAVSAGGKHSLALLSNGTVKAWGANGDGQLGDATSSGPEACPGFEASCSTTPVEASKLFDVKGIAGGGQHSLAFGPPPVVTKVEPNAGLVSGGTTVTITGTDFTAATAVKFGSTNAGFSVNSPTSITAVSPAEGAGVRDVTVTTGWGTSATSPADQFTYVSAGPPPTIKRLSPKEGPAAGGTPVTIKGKNFTGVTAVKFGSTNATSFTVNSAKSITAVSPAGPTGKVAVTVTTPNGTNASSKRNQFKYV